MTPDRSTIPGHHFTQAPKPLGAPIRPATEYLTAEELADLLPTLNEIAEPGETEIVDAEDRVFLVTLDKVHAAATDSPEAEQMRAGIENRLADSLRQDVFEYFTRAIRNRAGVTVNQTAIDAVNTQMQ